MQSIVKAALISLAVLLVAGGVIFLLQKEKTPNAEAPPPAIELVDKEGGAKPEPRAEKKQPLEHLAAPGDVTFTTRVVDQTTKKSLPRSSLLVTKVTEGDRPGEKMFESGRRAQGASNGEFRVTVPPGAYIVRAQCPSYTSQSRTITVIKDQTAAVVLELDRGNSISGRILKREGMQGIAGARVMAYPQIGNPDASLIERLIKIVDIQQDAQRPPEGAVSAEDGSYVIDGLEKRYYTVKAVASHFTPSEVSKILPSADGVNLKLAAGGQLSGTVVDTSGGAVPNAKVMAYTHVDSQDLFSIIETRARPPFDTVSTGGDGSFRFETLGAGTYNFLVAAAGYQEGRFLKVRVREGENPTQPWVISRGLRISGRVLASSGEPVTGAKVRATKNGETARSEQIFIKFDDASIPTDVQGRFVFDTLEPGKYTVLAWHQNHASEQLRDVDAGNEDITITLPEGGRIAGVITEAGSSNPVAGARISVSDMQDLRKEAVTDEKGFYTVLGLNVNGQSKKYLNIHADGFARLSNVQVHVEDGKTAENQNFELHRTSLVSGRIVNKLGQGVAEARVMAKRKAPNAPVPITVGSSIAGEDGRYSIKDLEAGEETVLSVLTSDYLEGQSAPFSVQPGQSLDLADLVLELGGQIQGVVIDGNNRPVSGVQVSVRLEGQTTADVSLSATTDGYGQFRLRGLSQGTMDLVAKSQHYLEETVTGVKVAEGLITKDVRIVLKQGQEVKGLVVDTDGKPVRDAQVVAHDVSESGGLKEIRAESDQDGRFAVEGILSSESIELSVEHPDYGSWQNDKVPLGGEVKAVLPRLGGIRVTVVDPEGKPIPSFSIAPQAKESGDSRRKPSPKTFTTGSGGRDGTVEYTGLSPGAYDVYIRAPSYAAATLQNVQIEGQISDLGKVVLEEGGRLSGTVVDSQGGRPVAGAQVRVLGGLVKFNSPASTGGSRSPGDQSVAVTDARGGFEFRNLKPGTVSVQITARGYVTKRVEDLDSNIAEKSRDLRIPVELGAEIEGTVIDADGNAKNGVSVYLTGVGEMANNPDSNQRTATNSEGRFQFQGLAAGTYRVTAQRIGGEPGSNPSVEVPVGAGVRQPVELVFE